MTTFIQTFFNRYKRTRTSPSIRYTVIRNKWRKIGKIRIYINETTTERKGGKELVDEERAEKN